jgi:hypothetical protein
VSEDREHCEGEPGEEVCIFGDEGEGDGGEEFDGYEY